MSPVEKMTKGQYRLQVARIGGWFMDRFLFVLLASPFAAYFVGNAIMHKEFSLGMFLMIGFGGAFLLGLFVPIFATLLLLCEMYAEYLACLLFPRKK